MTGKWSKTTKRIVIIAAAIVLVIIIAVVVLFVDFDRDGLPNYQELSLGTGILTADTDSDDLQDGLEVNTYQTDPLSSDTDNDGLGDGSEVNVYQTDPLSSDTDSDDLQDGLEVNTYQTDPLSSDTDNDNLDDFAEITTYQTDPLVADTDSDDLQDGLEVNTYQTNPSNPDTDSDSLWDGEEVAIWSTDPLSPSPQPSITVVPNKTGISAILFFETEDSISCRVRYGTDANYGEEISEVRTGTAHLIILPDLTPNLEYRYTIGASYNGRDVYSKDRTFTSRNAVNNWDDGLQTYTVNLFAYFNFDANQDNFDTWESYLEEAAEWIYDMTDGYIRVGTVAMADSPEGGSADFDNVADMKIRSGYNSTGDVYNIDRLSGYEGSADMEFGIDGDYYESPWTGQTGNTWAPWVITHEFCHYALGLPDEYDGGLSFCTNNTYDSSLMSSRGYWPGYDSAGNLLPFEYYSELCTDGTHTPGTNWEGTYIEDSMWRTLDQGDPSIPSPGYQNIPDNYYTGSATPIQDVGPDWDGALSFIIINF